MLGTPGSHFKSPITLWQFATDQNGPGTSLIGPRGANLWEKNGYKKSRETVPLTSISILELYYEFHCLKGTV